ncbi:MAG: energy transducer TonB [Verrucomicrobiales bacterium]
MFQLAEIDPCQKHACPRQAGGARLALALTLGFHGLLLAALAAVHLKVPPAPVARGGELQALFTANPSSAPDQLLLEGLASQAPRLSPTGSELQLRELPYAPSEIAIPQPVPDLEALRENPVEFGRDFMPEQEPPTKVSAGAPPVEKSPKSKAKPGRASTAKPQVVAGPKILSAKVRSTSRPSYPASAKRRGHEGVAQIRLSLDAAGDVTGSVVARSSGHAALDAAALKAAARWKFSPATSGGNPIASVIVVPIRFSLR